MKTERPQGKTMANKKLPFKLLNDNAVSEDAFKDKTHQKLADTLYEVISSHDEGMTIGLEGSWGSGKSTIISILREKLETHNKKKKNKIHYFYFDAWEHEGDPLRQIFLEELIERFETNNPSLEDEKKKITKNHKEVETHTTRTVKKFGKWLAILTFFVPLGIALVSGTINDVVFYNTGRLHWKFIIGGFLSLLPVFLVIGNCFRSFINCCRAENSPKKTTTNEIWAIFGDDRNEDVYQEISEDNERSSIEFEKYFRSVINKIIGSNKKIVIVLDNLDRINPEDSLKIWSTMQTFLQRRNPSDDEDSDFNRIWTIIPYDSEGLKKLWGKGMLVLYEGLDFGDNFNNSRFNLNARYDDSDNLSKSFFDKCFQLRLHVPNLILDSWEEYCKNLMKKTLGGWKDKEFERAVNILKWNRDNLVDTPTPREIKTYINQIGIMRYHLNNDIPIDAICCFAYEKYLQNKTHKEIREDLITGNFPNKRLKTLINRNNIETEISSILFDIDPDKAIQILLEKPIKEAFESRDKKQIMELFNVHQSTFWYVLEIVLSTSEEQKLISYSQIVHDSLFKLNAEKCKFFADKINRDIPTWREISFPDKSGFMNKKEDYFAMRDIVVNSNGPIETLCKLIGESYLKHGINKDDNGFGLIILSEFTKYLSEDSDFVINTNFINYEKWKIIAMSSDRSNKYLTKYLIMPDEILEEIIKEISTIKIYNGDALVSVIKYATKCINANWLSVLMELQKQSQEWDIGAGLSMLYIRILDVLYFADIETRNQVKEIIGNHRYWNYISYYNKNKDIKQSAALTLGRFYSDFGLINLSNIYSEALSEFNIAVSWWKTANIENAQFVLEKCKPINDYKFIWELAKNPQNKLVGDIIKIAVNEKNFQFLNYNSALSNYLLAFGLFESDLDLESLTVSFCKLSNIENEILKNKNFIIKNDVNEYETLMDISENIDLKNILKQKIDKYWDEHPAE